MNRLLITAVAAVTTVVATLAWRGFSEGPERYLLPLLGVAALVAVSGELGRNRRVPALVLVPAQLVVTGWALVGLLAGSWLPDPSALAAARDAIAAAVESARLHKAPVPVDGPGVDPLLLVFGAGFVLVVDALASTWRRPSLVALPLLTMLAVPVAVTGDPGWGVFAATALGLCLVLALDQAGRVRAWGRRAGSGSGRLRHSVLAGGVAVSATALAVTGALVVPTVGLDGFGLGPGSGGREQVTLTNPMADLRRDLRRPDDVPLMRVRTDDPDPSYLRIAVLNRFAGSVWSPGDRDIPSDQSADGPMPPPQGVLANITSRSHEWELRATGEFTSTWLPVPTPALAVEATGDWRYDLATMDFLAARTRTDTAGLEYRATGMRLDLDGERMRLALPGRLLVDPQFIELPGGLPQVVEALAEEVTADLESDFEKAVALQRWFRSDGGFTYSLDVAPGSGSDDLVNFLTVDRTGYCEQFAAAMAAMARSLGIPARVAIGFLAGERLDNGEWEYSAHDLHAWVEIFIRGHGWVLFEPTPSDRAVAAPGYTERVEVEPGVPDPTAAPTPTPEPTTAPPDPGVELPDEEQPSTGDDTGQAGVPWRGLAVLAALVGVAALLACVPRVLRMRRRRTRRRAGATAEDAWQEMRDAALDLGYQVPRGRSPQEAALVVAGWFATPSEHRDPVRPERGPETNPAAAAALDRLVRALEEQRYSATGGVTVATDLHADTDEVVAGLRAGAPHQRRRRADWLPASLWPTRRE
ncbi:transglutaminase family protein [Nocardioides limicola]|uniref:transglutaminase family protein n=1 Tax=Nocardioides limicola TaxID=2803368 RepID=UPI00193B46B6|nr:DUF3488 and transglutaminase-like domain-containing protein [Nocardioides sp. DJM-14]